MIRLTALCVLWLIVAPASIFSDIAGFFTGGVKTLKDVVSKMWSAFKHLLNWATGIFRNVGAAWGDLHYAFRTLISGLEHLAEGSYAAIRWLSGTLVPKWARRAITDAISWATRNIKTVAKRAETLANQVKSWAVGRLNTVLNYAKKGINVITKAVNKVADFVRNRGNWLWDTVRHPAKLVTWILPSLVTPLFRYVEQHLEGLSLSVMRWAFSNIGKLALEIERAVAKIL